MKSEYTIRSIEDLPQVARDFISNMGDRKIFAFYAPMGTGKTTFIKALCEEMGVQDVINSPTFSIINEYLTTPDMQTIYHFDCYRLEGVSDALNLGVEDYFESGAVCFVEWPEVLEPILPDDVVKVNIKEEADGARVLQLI
ncbi:MAG: tRNA (adenosine(37)-N6)-threonylcarbamoyltransferase complex ATPase subunit type 1 TsaE [Porphyromonas sp.]|nr:tRNA (adenosine(37)-N6)-threonylcarbamoyltransferase complex ATPase subunit type 1 TsaE [Porphyromonas sp.]